MKEQKEKPLCVKSKANFLTGETNPSPAIPKAGFDL